MTLFFSNFHFIRPGWLLMVPVAIAVWFYWKRSIEPLRGWRDQVDPDLLKAMMTTESTGDTHNGFWILVAWMLAIVAVAGPTWKQEPNPFASDSAPLMILLKADQTMDQGDFPPTSLERGQLKISDLVKIRKGQPIGLIAYAGSAHLVLPPTRDTSIVADMAAEISPDIMPQPGDRLDLALRQAGKILLSEETAGTLLVIANSVGQPVDTIAQSYHESGSFPLQFLALRDDESLSETARALDSSLTSLTPDDQDVLAISRNAEQKALISISGESQRWHESGYWLVPFLALIVACSFRREQQKSWEDSQ